MYNERRGRRNNRGFGPGRFAPKPVETGKEYDVTIEEMSRRGEGIARIKGFVIFVPNTKTGDNIRIRVTRISRRFAEAEAVGEAKKAPTESDTGEVAEEAATGTKETETTNEN